MSKLACLTRGRDRAFPAHPRVDRYFPAAAIEDARNRLARCIDRGDGPGLAIGATGTGKTLLLQLLATQFADRFSVACLASTPLSTRRALLQAILFELHRPYRDREEGELRLALVELLLDRQCCPDGLLLLIDEAHLLPARLLEELRILSNLTCAGEPRVRLVLAGSLQLDELFTAPELEVFSQRLAARCYLTPLTHRETVEYARAQVSAAGAKPDELFAPEALDALYQATDGIPRLVNQVCDRALLLAVDRGLKWIDKAVMEAAWSDLQQLPNPWAVSHEPAQAANPSVIEFGTLDDDRLAPVEEPTEVDSVEEVQALTGPTMRVFQSPVADEQEAQEHEPAEDGSRPPDHWPNNPFAESFEEEEVVLDRFATLEAAFHTNTPRVWNRRESSWSHMLYDVEANEDRIAASVNIPLEGDTPPLVADGFDNTRESSLDECRQPHFSLHAEPIGTPPIPVSPSTAQEPDVLCIEDDAPVPANGNQQVERKDYRQLFASLRG